MELRPINDENANEIMETKYGGEKGQNGDCLIICTEILDEVQWLHWGGHRRWHAGGRLDPMTGLYVRNFAILHNTYGHKQKARLMDGRDAIITCESADRRHKRDAWLRSVLLSATLKRRGRVVV